MFLWHFPWGHPPWVLPSILPGGARTFLPPKAGGHPVYLAHLHYIIKGFISQQLTGLPNLQGSISQSISLFILLAGNMPYGEALQPAL